MSDEKPRVESPDRRQLPMAPLDLERIIPEEHPARAVWAAKMPLIEEEREERAQKNGKKAKAKELRVSTTDPESRVMKMADGGYVPAPRHASAATSPTTSSGFGPSRWYPRSAMSRSSASEATSSATGSSRGAFSR
jgi:hypothetical protein